MYRYDQYDHLIVRERIAQFRDQVRRRLAGELTEDEFRPLRLQNGLYMQRHAYMLRIAIPYGLLSSRAAAHARAHRAQATTAATATSPRARTCSSTGRSSTDVPDILAELAAVEMHAHPDLRQLHPQHHDRPLRRRRRRRDRRSAPVLRDPAPVVARSIPSSRYLPRKFKIAVNGAAEDRAAIARARHRPARWCATTPARSAFACMVGGGLGRTPIIGSVIREFLPWQHLLTYLEAILRVYNRYGRRDNKYKARIKILRQGRRRRGVRAPGRGRVGATCKDGPATLTDEEIAARRPRYFAPPAVRSARRRRRRCRAPIADNRAFASWVKRNVTAAQGAGLRRRHAVAQEDRRAAGRRDRRPDGRRRRPGRPLQLRRAARHARAEPDAGATSSSATLFALWQRAQGARPRDAEHRPADRHRSAARAATSARSPTPSRSRSPRRSPSASTTSTTCTTSARSTSTSPAASTPAATTTSATSASSASTRTAASGTRSRSAARRATTLRSARSSDRRSPRCKCRTWSPACCKSMCASASRTNASSTCAQRLGVAPFKEFVYATPIAEKSGRLVGEDEYV